MIYLLISLALLFSSVSTRADEGLGNLRDGDWSAYHVTDSKGNIVGRALYEIDRTEDNLIDIKTRLERHYENLGRIRILETALTLDSAGTPLHLTTYFAYKDKSGALLNQHREQITFKNGTAQRQVRNGEDLILNSFKLPEEWFPFVSQELHSWVLASALWKPKQKGDLILYPTWNKIYTQRYYIRGSRSDFIQIGEKKYDCRIFFLSFRSPLKFGGGSGPARQGKGSHIELDARAASQSLTDVRRAEKRREQNNPFFLSLLEQFKRQYFNDYSSGGATPVTCKLYVKDGKLIALERPGSKLLINEDITKVKTKYDFIEK